MRDYTADARELHTEITELRHRLHSHPETGNDVPWTQSVVLDALAGLDLEVTKGTGSTSVTAVLRGGAAPDGERPIVLLRADMDGLPVQEETGWEHASQRAGFMHGCGHDVHTSSLVGAARLLHARRDELPGDVVFMFQPGEELLTGAPIMIAEGVLDAAGRRADRAFGMHVFSSIFPAGTWSTRPGPIMAASDSLTVDLVGKGGHGSAPHLANDPVPVMAEVISAIQTVIAKKFAATDPVIINVGVASAGEARNVIPERCHLDMSIRTFSDGARDRIEQVLPALVEGIASAHGVRAEMVYARGVGPTVCDPEQAAFAERVIRGVVGDRYFELESPLGGSEDFSEVLNLVPGAFIAYSGVPAGTDLADTTYNHSATAFFDDAVLPEAMAVYATLAHEALDELAAS
ncbi:amidohydrolase [Propioniciclava coleopterorum]|uniref:Amidohydrolase n=2 Tax=Propioniciclava coleopterorum TaxID=2714937 RepID=A0A6G7YBE6_9ACTN|nr:amidohydrolase [Propioniciclava coleopterorum]